MASWFRQLKLTNHLLVLIVLIVFSTFSVAYSLSVRWAYRGSYFPGWDILGHSLGQHLIFTNSLWSSIVDVFYSLRHFQCWNSTNSLFYTFIPGFLGAIYPWEYWSHLLTFFLTAFSFWIAIKALHLPARKFWLLFLCFGASPALLSFSIAGYPYILGCLPHAIALWITLNKRLHHKPLVTLALCLFANELSWNFYELGKSLFLVYIAAAICFRNVALRVRATWLLASSIQIAMLYKYTNSNIEFFLYQEFTEMSLNEIIVAVRNFLDLAFVSYPIDLPVILALGSLSLILEKRYRWFLVLLIGSQLGLGLMLSLKGIENIRPRRFLLLDFYCLLSVVNLFCSVDHQSEVKKIFKNLVVVLLIFGNIWSMKNLNDHTEVPVYQNEFAMPYTMSQADYLVRPNGIRSFLNLKSRVEYGEKIILLYSYLAHSENSTDPVAILERLYLSLGHAKFVDSVFVFSSLKSRYSSVPIRQLEEVTLLSRNLRNSAHSLDSFVIYFEKNLLFGPDYAQNKVYLADWRKIFAEFQNNFWLITEPSQDPRFIRFRIAKKTPQSSSSYLIRVLNSEYIFEQSQLPIQQSTYPYNFIWLDEQEPYVSYANALNFDTSNILQHPSTGQYVVHIDGELEVYQNGIYSLMVGSNNLTSFDIAGSNVRVNTNYGLQIVQNSFYLERGVYPFRLIYHNNGMWYGHLFFDINQETERQRYTPSQ